jgi:hypothetical protein
MRCFKNVAKSLPEALCGHRRRNDILVVDESGHVREHLSEGHCIRDIWQAGQPLAQRIVETQLAIFCEQQNGRGGELLRHGSQSVVRRGCRNRSIFDIAEPVRTTHERFAIADHQQRCAGYIAVVAAHQLINLCLHATLLGVQWGCREEQRE